MASGFGSVISFGYYPLQRQKKARSLPFDAVGAFNNLVRLLDVFGSEDHGNA